MKHIAVLFVVKQKVGERLEAFYERFRAEQAHTQACTSEYARRFCILRGTSP